MKKLKVLSLIFAGFLLFSCSNFFDFSEAQKPFSVTFNSNGGSGTMEQQEFFRSESQALIMNRFSRTGYEFAGWVKKANANEVEYIDGQTVSFNNAVTLYAKWNANKYTVKFDKNAADATGDVADIQAVYDTEFALPENAFAKIGYNFGGWNTKKDGSGTTHKAGEKMKNLSAENGDVVTIYANWIEKGTHSITYELNGGNHDGTPTTSFLETKDVTLGTAARTGYTFSGWYEAEDFSGNAVTGWNAGEKTEDVTLYAKWLETYTITYELNGGTNAAGNPESYNVETETITLKAATKFGYALEGWYKEASFATKVTEIAKGSTGNITLYAKWIITADTVADAIGALSGEGPHDIAVVGKITSETISVIKNALKSNEEAKVNLDLSQTTGLTSIGSSVFFDCSNLTNVTIPDSVTSIGDYAFFYCSSLTSVTIGNGVIYIDSHAFADCKSLTSVTIGNGVTSIGSSAFYGCKSLTSVTIPDGVTSIGDYAFYNCSSLASVTIPNSVTSIGNSAFYGCSSLKFNEFDNAKYLGNENNPYLVLIEAKDTSITSCNINTVAKVIAGFAFSSCRSLTSVTIPDGVTSIGDYAFYNCSSLASVTIPNSVTSIGNSAFYGCSSLKFNEFDNAKYLSNENNPYLVLIGAKDTSITSCNINTATKMIVGSAFANCNNLTSVTIPNSVTYIGDYAFNGCSSLTSVTIPDGVTSIGDYAFNDCKSLTSVTIGNGVTSIGSSAFSGCISLTSVTIPDGVTSIGDSAFSSCKSLTSVTIPDSVTSIGGGTFNHCSSLTSVTIPDSVTSIGGGAFNHCSNLTTVNYKGSEEQWNVISISNGNDSLTSATINYNYTGE